MNGVLVIDKPAGFTSFDVVAKLRGILKMKKIGHGGTLDPQATGVLQVFIGEATRLCDYLPDDEKIYEAEMTLGVSTDTGDIWGEVREEDREKAAALTEEEVRKAVLSFKGPYEQIPPMVSAKKVDGKKLYEYARKGVEIERKPVSLTIYDISVDHMDLPRVRFTVNCSKGTYIRVLCEDIGKKLGVPACMSALRRVRHGRFDIASAVSLDTVETAAHEGKAEMLLIPTEALFDHPKVKVSGEAEKRLKNGNKMPCTAFPEVTAERICVYDSQGRFNAVYKRNEKEGMYIPEKMFIPRD